MAQLGRISGPMLEADLLLNGRNLSIKDTALSTPLLYLDAVNSRIGINTDSPATELEVVGGIKFTKVILIDPQDYGNLTVQDGSLSVVTGNLTIGAASQTILPGLQTDDFLFDGNRITSLNSNANLEFSPNGTGEIDLVGIVNVSGDLTSTGNITIGGNITFGDDSTVDSVTISGPIASSIVPKFDYLNSIGTPSKRYARAYANRVNIETLTLEQGLNLPGQDVTLEQGNTFYVSTNGSDSFTGTRTQEPLRTIKAALQAADASSAGPVMIHIAPGTYDEDFPLEVPQNVAISGEEMRNVIIRPNTGTESNDAFLLNDTTTIENITVTGFFYDSIGNTGYAFRFKNEIDIVSRSPYVRNCSVITQGSSTPDNDPRGYDEGDAGRGALVDGAEINSTSPNVSMLFYSVTFICPGADILTVTNGARAELINIFTYFGSKSIHVSQGVGRIGLDGSTTEYGGELRVIGSASCYGEEGILADGADTLVYAINHNFHYIGSGKDKENDRTLQIEDNQIIEANNGKIYYTSIDSVGKYKIGDSFYVDFEQGFTSISGNINFSGGSRIKIVDGFKETIITASTITQQNIFITDNTISTVTGDLNFLSQNSNLIYFNDNMNISGSLEITGDIDISGNVISLGSEQTDTVDFNVPFDQNLNPGDDSRFTIGSNSYNWNILFAKKLAFDDIEIFNNVITTTQSNSNLDLRSSGLGKVRFSNISLDSNIVSSNFNQPITLSSSTNIIDLSGNSALVLAKGTTAERRETLGDLRYNIEENNFEGYSTFNQRLSGLFSDDGRTGIRAVPIINSIYFKTDDLQVANIDVNSFQFERVHIDGTIIENNTIATSDSNSNLEILARGSGNTYIGTNIGFNDESWLNETNSTFIIDITDFGKVRFTDTFGISLPTGTTAERPTLTEEGLTRYNTTEEELESWTGTKWVPSLGEGADINQEEFDEIRTIWALVLG